MTRKRRRVVILLACAVGVASAAGLSLAAFSSSIELFVAPSDLAKLTPGGGRTFRLGGLVEAGTLIKSDQGTHPTAHFKVTDGRANIEVNYAGILPDLLREGQGVVALGKLAPDGSFQASEVLAKHDETYMPKDVADALKASGRWNPSEGPPPPAATWTKPAT
jgi:cytochrome c-type biogenesis protein CcmE